MVNPHHPLLRVKHISQHCMCIVEFTLMEQDAAEVVLFKEVRGESVPCHAHNSSTTFRYNTLDSSHLSWAARTEESLLSVTRVVGWSTPITRFCAFHTFCSNV